jgi:hypothetical protein
MRTVVRIRPTNQAGRAGATKVQMRTVVRIRPTNQAGRAGATTPGTGP